MAESDSESDWKLRLRYGKLTTPFSHFTILAEGKSSALKHGFKCRPGPAWMGMKAWVESAVEASRMIEAIAADLGFTITGKILVYSTEPQQPPGEIPRAYDINFKPFDDNAETETV